MLFARYSFLILSTLLMPLVTIAADDSERGRLPDGRAFRTDEQGNQLVDYIAELELSVEALNRQMRGLEDENRQKQGLIDRLQSSGAKDTALQERNLGETSNSVSKVNLKESCKPCDCTAQIASVRCPESNCSTEVKLCEEKLEDARIDKQIIAQREAELSALKNNLNELEAKLVSANEEKSKAQQELQTASENAIRVRNETEQREKELREKEALVKASVKLDSESSAQVATTSNAALSQSRIQAVDILRGRMVSDLNSLQGLIAHRDRMIRDSGRSIPNASETRNAVAALRNSIATASKVHELSTIRAEINSLRGKVQEEIALIKRQQKIR